jgi:hypothetical protein
MEKQFNSLNEAVFSVFFSYYFLKGKHKMDEISKSEYYMKIYAINGLIIY